MPPVVLAAGDMPALLVASENTYHQPWRPPCGVTIPVDPSSKSEMTFGLAAQARVLLPPVPVPVPPVPVLPPVADEPPLPVLPPVADEPPAPVLPPVPGAVPPVPVLPPVLPPPTQLPLLQVCPAPHLLPQLPQLVVVVMSTQLPLQRLWLDEPQLQEPLTQVVPPVQALPQVPQSAELVFELQAPSVHLVPDEQVDEQVPSLLQTSLPEQAVQLEPQCCAFEATHDPPQETNPLVQLH
jgi:hypothetical protein